MKPHGSIKPEIVNLATNFDRGEADPDTGFEEAEAARVSRDHEARQVALRMRTPAGNMIS